MTNADRMRDDQLNDFLDALVAGESSREIDPATTEAARRFFARDDAPAPPRDLDSQIWEELINQQALAGSIPLKPSVALPAVNGRNLPRPWQRGPVTNTGSHCHHRPAFVRLAIAAILLISLGFGFFAFEPFRADPKQPERLPAAVAPAATPTATPFPMADHPIIGVWLFDNELRQPGTDTSTVTFTDSGTFVESSVEFGWIAVGTWRATGERTLEVVDVLQELGPQDMFAPDYAPEGNLFAPGTVVHRGVLEVDATGTTVTFTGTVEFRDGDGTVQGSGTFESRGTRMVVVATAANATPTP